MKLVEKVDILTVNFEACQNLLGLPETFPLEIHIDW